MKEALACCLYWANNRKQWVEIGHQQALKTLRANEDKAKAFKDKTDSIAYNIAVSTPYLTKQIFNKHIEQSSSSGQTKCKVSPLQQHSQLYWELSSPITTNQRNQQRNQ